MRTAAQHRAPALAERIPAQLRRVFGLRRLRPGQLEAITRTLRGLNTLAVMPTGAGKSLCYQLPASLLPGLTVVVSPLISLMQDQCAKLDALGIPAVQLNSALDAPAERAALQALAGHQARVVFTTPERLGDAAFLPALAGQSLSLLVVDEAHCISHWGDDFRPAFGEIGSLLPALGSPPVLALTATATDAVIADIAEQLRIPAAGIFAGSSYRANLQLAVETMADAAARQQRAVALMAAVEGSAMAYTATVKAAEALHAALAEAGVDAGLYHGRLPVARRRAAQQAFMDGSMPRMVATNAFGLGIDKPDIRLVLHHQLPGSLDAYYQEAGRAGRDGGASRCLLLFLAGDRAVQQFFLNGRYPAAEDGRALVDLLRKPQDTPWTLASLKEKLDRPATKLRVLLNLLRREGWLRIDAEDRITVDDAAAPPDLDALLSRHVDKREQDHTRLEQMVAYAQTGACRWRTLLQAFEEPAPFSGDRCGHCDNCRRMAEHERTLDTAEGEDAPAPVLRPRFAQGDAVRVRRYGAGIVVAASTESITVQFGHRKGEGDGEEQRRNFHPDFVRPVRGAAASAAR